MRESIFRNRKGQAKTCQDGQAIQSTTLQLKQQRVGDAAFTNAMNKNHDFPSSTGSQPMPEAVQRRIADALDEPDLIQRRADSVNKTGLPDQIKNGIENLSGLTMDDVKVHYNSSKPAQLQAHAYTQGTEIHVGPGQEKHLAHEAWHVVQQKEGRVKPTMQMAGQPVNDQQHLEKEADVMGAKALSYRKQTQVHQPSSDGRSENKVAQKAGLHVVQRAQIFAGPYRKIMEEFLSQPGVPELIKKVLEGGDIQVKRNNEDDTYWDRTSRTIMVSNKKRGSEAGAAILFELNNAANPHVFTDQIEKNMESFSQQEISLTGPDFFRIGQHMEKDEFESLKSYKPQVEGSSITSSKKKVYKHKYEGILDQSGELDYQKFNAQNASSGHTLDLARAQYTAYTGFSSGLDEIMPLRLRQPTRYQSHLNGGGSSRNRSTFEKLLEQEKKLNLDQETPGLFDFNSNQKKEEMVDDMMDDSEDNVLTFDNWLLAIQQLFQSEYAGSGLSWGDSDAPFADGYYQGLTPGEFYEQYMRNYRYFY